MRARIRIQDRHGRAEDRELDQAVEVGRDVDPPHVRVDDPAASRRHLRLDIVEVGLVVTDLDSSNGTLVDGRPATGPVVAGQGALIQLGDTTIIVLAVEDDTATDRDAPTGQSSAANVDTGPPVPAEPPEPAEPAEPPEPPEPPGDRASPPPADRPVRPAAARAAGDQEVLEGDAVIVRFRPRSAGSQSAKSIAAAAAKARRRLAGLGSEPWGGKPTIHLADPFPAPGMPGELVTEGSIVDPDNDEIWMVATDESPPEDPARPLALLFGSHLPAADDLEPVLEGYGMVIAGADDPAEQLRTLDLPPLSEATGDLRTAMATSYVHHLLEREGEEGLRRFLGTSRPGNVDESARDVYGLSPIELETAWRRELAEGEQRVPTRLFLRMSLEYLRPHALRQAEIFVYMLFGLAFTMVFPFISRRLFDTAIPSGEFSQVLSLLGVLGIAFLVSLLAGLRRAYVTAYVSSSIVTDVRQRMFDRLQILDSAWFNRYQQGDVLSRMFSDVGAVQRGLSETLSEGVFQAISLVVAAIVMVNLDPLLGGIVLVGAPMVAIVYRVMGEGARKRSLAVQEQSSRLLSISGENFAAGPVVKVFGLAGRERERFERAANRLFKSQIRLNLYGGIFGLSVNTIVTFLRLFVLGFGAWLILEGRFTLGGLVAFLGLMGEVISPVTMLTNIGQELQAATGALQRVNEVLDTEPAIVDRDDARDVGPLQNEIRFVDVSFSYDGQHPTLQNLDLVIPAGAKVAFVGPSGSGKSTVLQLLMRMYDPDEGAILFDGVDLRQATIRSHRDQLGVVFQDNFLFGTTVTENIELGRIGSSAEDVRAAARAAEVDDFIDRLPRGFDTLVGERGGLLSGGQRQRVAIARALIREPSVLVLDEATSALDPRTERQINDTLDRASTGRTTVSVTHRLTSVVDYDLIFVLVDGELVEQGTHDELRQRGGAYARLWAEQTGDSSSALQAAPLAEMIARVSLFAELDDAGVATVANHVTPTTIAPGTVLQEGAEPLVFVLEGVAEVRGHGLGGAETALAELGTGDVFGLTALLGNPTGAELHARTECRVGVVDDAAIRTLAAEYPSVAAALEGERPGRVGPAGGRRLSRATFVDAPRRPSMVDGGDDVAAENRRMEREVRRASGTFGRIAP
ncbi:MAG: ATP-binding cassette domain-containing protein [Acidimicrobiales bacterium]|nr:ATP-binding cassette domain-containing protein [Acidimicrobiales bacterium]